MIIAACVWATNVSREMAVASISSPQSKTTSMAEAGNPMQAAAFAIVPASVTGAGCGNETRNAARPANDANGAAASHASSGSPSASAGMMTPVVGVSATNDVISCHQCSRSAGAATRETSKYRSSSHNRRCHRGSTTRP